MAEENHYLAELAAQTEDEYRYTLKKRWAKVCQEIPANSPIIETETEAEQKLKSEEVNDQ